MNSWGFFAAAGGLTSVSWLLQQRKCMGLSENEFWAGVWTVIIGGIVGAKLLFLLLGWEHYARGELRFWADFDVGFVFFGGLIGALVASLLFSRLRQLDYLRGADYFSVAIPMGHSFGRVGCFFIGCCGGHPPHPVQLYEAFGLLLISAGCCTVLSGVKKGRFAKGTAFFGYLLSYGILRFLLDPFRADGRPEEILGLSYQQLIAIALVAFSILGMRYSQLRKS